MKLRGLAINDRHGQVSGLSVVRGSVWLAHPSHGVFLELGNLKISEWWSFYWSGYEIVLSLDTGELDHRQTVKSMKA